MCLLSKGTTKVTPGGGLWIRSEGALFWGTCPPIGGLCYKMVLPQRQIICAKISITLDGVFGKFMHGLVSLSVDDLFKSRLCDLLCTVQDSKREIRTNCHRSKLTQSLTGLIANLPLEMETTWTSPGVLSIWLFLLIWQTRPVVWEPISSQAPQQTGLGLLPTEMRGEMRSRFLAVSRSVIRFPLD